MINGSILNIVCNMGAYCITRKVQDQGGILDDHCKWEASPLLLY